MAVLAFTTHSNFSYAADVNVNIGYQPIVEPSRVPQADGTYEKVTGAKINWQKFDSGADVITAVASGSLDIGYVGSSPLAAAASREIPIETIFVVGLISEAEALAVKNIDKPEDLAGKKIATPFVSTAHYSLLTALKHWKVDPKSVEILNLRPPEIAAAWERGDIDGAYVWDPVLSELKKTGSVLATSADVAKWGGPTFDAWIVSKKFAEEHPDVVTGFVQVTGKAYADYRANPDSWKRNIAGSGKNRQAHRRKGRGSAGSPEGLSLPDAGRAGRGRSARWRHGKGGCGNIRLPFGAGQNPGGSSGLRALRFVALGRRSRQGWPLTNRRWNRTRFQRRKPSV